MDSKQAISNYEYILSFYKPDIGDPTKRPEYQFKGELRFKTEHGGSVQESSLRIFYPNPEESKSCSLNGSWKYFDNKEKNSSVAIEFFKSGSDFDINFAKMNLSMSGLNVTPRDKNARWGIGGEALIQGSNKAPENEPIRYSVVGIRQS